MRRQKGQGAGRVARVVGFAGLAVFLAGCGAIVIRDLGPEDEAPSDGCGEGSTRDEGCEVPEAARALDVTPGYAHTCALLVDGAVKCWGEGSAGQLGLGDAVPRGDDPGEMGDDLPAVSLGTGETVEALAAGSFHHCALLRGGRVKCWGGNASGSLGLGDGEGRGLDVGSMGENLPTVDLGTGVTAVALVAGGETNCALLPDRTLKCWGDNGYGQLGLGDVTPRGNLPGTMGDDLPAVDLGVDGAGTAVFMGAAHVCALLTRGAVKCWGANGHGQLGLGDADHRGDAPGEMGDALPDVDLGAGNLVAALALGRMHSCALLKDGSVKCWGDNERGQLGLGDTELRGDAPGEMGDALPRVDLGSGKRAVAITAGDLHTCALLDDGSLKCWGDSYWGQLGLGDREARGDEPGEMGDALPGVNLGTGEAAVLVRAGSHHTCVRLSGGHIKCWGYNDGRLGLGDIADRGMTPETMGDGLPIVAL
ncbi:RCC1 domain-containing protein [Chondromyces crocatus]|uniref:Chromosome condensation regulator RCC1 n=1 Tax=Chondromyces crocatus TaxID=52 RepID=A0A0K1EC39_CHOCO|nr:hypothetical protein [Chondromyces crocatus]AKT38424.1 uncharacterized protein CMC5_025700 [Chondromyces crocatus]